MLRGYRVLVESKCRYWELQNCFKQGKLFHIIYCNDSDGEVK